MVIMLDVRRPGKFSIDCSNEPYPWFLIAVVAIDCNYRRRSLEVLLGDE